MKYKYDISHTSLWFSLGKREEQIVASLPGCEKTLVEEPRRTGIRSRLILISKPCKCVHCRLFVKCFAELCKRSSCVSSPIFRLIWFQVFNHNGFQSIFVKICNWHPNICQLAIRNLHFLKIINILLNLTSLLTFICTFHKNYQILRSHVFVYSPARNRRTLLKVGSDPELTERWDPDRQLSEGLDPNLEIFSQGLDRV